MFSAFFLTAALNKIARDNNGLGFLSFFQFIIGRFIRYLPLYYFVFITTWTMLWWFDDAALLQDSISEFI
jgi:peptidoglycan/LPS O-acetylase OafA/YrhL